MVFNPCVGQNTVSQNANDCSSIHYQWCDRHYLLAFSYIIMNLINSFGAAIDYTKSAQIVAWFWACGIGAMIWLFALLVTLTTKILCRI